MLYIYIPIWLDLLLKWGKDKYIEAKNLHSNMVRFIILVFATNLVDCPIFTFQYG